MLLTSLASNAVAVDRAEAALRIAVNLSLPHTNDPSTLHGLFPDIFPGGFNGAADVSDYRRPATLETVVVTLVRWAGWDTVHYDRALAQQITPYVSPEGFPFYAPDPTPRSVPYVTVALTVGLMDRSGLPELRSAVALTTIDALCAKAKIVQMTKPILSPLVLDDAGVKTLNTAKQDPRRLFILPLGFSDYSLLRDVPNRILDLSSPNLRLFNAGSGFAFGKQDYFPLGAIESQLAVGLRVPTDSYTHESQAIHGSVENLSSTVNAVGIWASAASLKQNARVWGEFISASTAHSQDAQIVGLEVDVLNYALPGTYPNRSKTGIQIVGIGDAINTGAVEIMAADKARWINAILFEPGAIDKTGTVIGLAGNYDVARGINFAGTRFREGALLLKQGSSINFGNKIGGPSLIYTDDIGRGHLVLQAGMDGLRITSNDNSKNLLLITDSGRMATSAGTVGIRTQVPQTSHDACVVGEWATSEQYFYSCVSTNSWRRAALSNW